MIPMGKLDHGESRGLGEESETHGGKSNFSPRHFNLFWFRIVSDEYRNFG